MKQIQKKRQSFDMFDFGSIKISLMSPEKVKEISFGEVKKTETLNFRTLKPERDGLFCEKIFGPVKDYECSCGKYKAITANAALKYKNMECDRCGVEITESKVRRERMGHITLTTPVAHFWYFGKSPSKIAIVLDIMQEDVKDIVYGLCWVVTKHIDDIKDIINLSIDSIYSEIKSILINESDKIKVNEFFNFVLEELKKSKIPLQKKFVLKQKYLNDYLNNFNFIKIIKENISEIVEILQKVVNKKTLSKEEWYKFIIDKIISKLIDSLIDKYCGNIADEKNYLTAKIQTNAEALLSLLKDEDINQEIEKIREQLYLISKTENVNRIRILFDRYTTSKILLEDKEKILKIIENIKSSLKNKKDIEEIIKKFENEKIEDKETIKLSSTLKEVLIKEKISLEVSSILDSLFEKYGIEEIHLSSPRSKLITRFKLLESFITNNIKPEWMILQNLPILPPDLRPLVAIEGGKFASSDLNELYRRIIHRNNRLKKFCGRGDKKDNVESKGIPKLVLLNEKRLLQEAIDALIENSARKNPIINSQKRPLKSLTDILKGKQGRFRQNLLGKRIDYSGRSAIVVGPELKLYQCGLPKEMAFELFKPFILHRLMKKYNVSLKKAKNMLQTDNPEIWDIVEEVAKHHPVLLNRAPTLHRPSIQAFEPVLVEGKAIQIHPMVCTPYNADFDGDQMAVYVPLTLEAQIEAKLIMKSYFNLFSPANGKPLIGPTQDVVLGISYMTTEKPNEKGEGMIFSSQEEVIHAYQQGFVGLNAKIKVLGLNDLKENTKVEEWKDYTTVGRIIFNTILPEEISLFKDKSKNKAYGKKALFELVEECYQKCGLYQTVIFLDKMKTLGYHYATISGFTISVDDMLIPQNKQKEIDIAWEKVKEIEKQAKEGVITEIERYNSIIDIWSETIEKITKQLQQEMEKQNKEKIKEGKAKFNSVYLMANSGARGNIDQVKQLSAIRGLMSRPQRKIKGEIGEIIETPITSNFREGLNILEYFISTHGGRKGLSDTALKTSEAGYLTRRLADVAHHVVVTEEDCKTIKGIKVSALKIGDETIETLEDRIIGRVALQDIVIDTIDEKTAEIHPKIIVKSGQMISKQQTHEIIKAGIESIRIRSVLTCEAKNGVCAKCYGMDFSTGELVKVGEAVGVIAAQSIGEPGTQLTLRTFHIGGATARLVKQPKIVAPFEGEVEHHKLVSISKKNANGQEVLIVLTSDATIRLINKEKGLKQDWKLPYGSRVYIKNKSFIEKGTLIAEWDAYSIPIIAEKDGIIKYRDLIEGKTYVIEHRHAAGGIEERQVLPYRGRYNPGINIVNIHNKIIATYSLPVDSIILIKENDTVKAGDVIAKIPREEIKTKDITGGLPRVEELFEARHPQESAVLSEIDGVVKIETREQKDTDNIETIIKIINETSKKEIEYKIPAGRHLLVYDGDRVESGEPLTDGVIDPHKYLEIRGPQHTQELLLNEIQQVYRLQGVNINDKHIETIIKQMLSFVRIIDPGLPPKSTKSKKFYEFIYGEIVPKKLFEEEVEKIEQERKNLIKSGDSKEAAQLRPPKAEPILLGISRVASSSESFLSSASFQETSRVLTEAALEGKVDNLTGLKENVIIGRLIPAGTGFYSEETVSLNKEIKVSEKILI